MFLSWKKEFDDVRTDVTLQIKEHLLCRQTTCCIVGGGPAGQIWHSCLHVRIFCSAPGRAFGNFARDFRGDTIHPSVLEIMDEIGLADRLLQIPHTEIRQLTVQESNEPFSPGGL